MNNKIKLGLIGALSAAALSTTGCSMKTGVDYTNAADTIVRSAYSGRVQHQRDTKDFTNICNSEKMIKKYTGITDINASENFNTTFDLTSDYGTFSKVFNENNVSFPVGFDYDISKEDNSTKKGIKMSHLTGDVKGLLHLSRFYDPDTNQTIPNDLNKTSGYFNVDTNNSKIGAEFSVDLEKKIELPSTNPKLDQCLADVSENFYSKVGTIEKLIQFNAETGLLNGVPVPSNYLSSTSTPETKKAIAKNIAKYMPNNLVMGYATKMAEVNAGYKMQENVVDARNKDITATLIDTAIIGYFTGRSANTAAANSNKGTTVGTPSGSGSTTTWTPIQ